MKKMLLFLLVVLTSAMARNAWALELTGGAAKGRRCEIVFSGYEGKETLRDFPALIKIPDGLAGFDYAEAAENGQDIAFYGEDGRPLAHEIDTWNPEGDSYIWVKVPELSGMKAILPYGTSPSLRMALRATRRMISRQRCAERTLANLYTQMHSWAKATMRPPRPQSGAPT